MLKIHDETTEQAILRVLSETGTIQPFTLHRIMNETGAGHSPRAVAGALVKLRREGMIDQQAGASGSFWLTDHGKAYADIVPRPNTLQEVVPHPGGEALRILDGVLAIGTDVVGDAQHWQLWDSIGTIPMLAIGGTGAGGTGLLSGLVEAALPHHPDTRVWLVDTNHQMTEYWDRVEKVAVNEIDEWEKPGVISTADMLDQVLAVQRDRERILASAGKKAWNTPFDDLRLPLGILVIGFLGEIANDPYLRQKLSTISKLARKTGILIASHIHSPALDSFANDMALQDFFAAGNMLVLRQSTRLFGRMVSDRMERLPLIPRTFEDGSTTAGLGYMADGTLVRVYWASGL